MIIGLSTGIYLGGRGFGPSLCCLRSRCLLAFVILVLICVACERRKALEGWILSWLNERVMAKVIGAMVGQMDLFTVKLLDSFAKLVLDSWDLRQVLVSIPVSARLRCVNCKNVLTDEEVE